MIIKNMGFQSNKHEILVNAKDMDKAFGEIVLWGEAEWWPKKCTMKFIRIGNVPIQKGTLYRQEVLLPFAPSWASLVTDIVDKKSITRSFHEGFLDATETINLSPEGKNIKIEYLMQYKVKGKINRVLWKLFFGKMHDKNINLILKSLKRYLEKD